MDRYQAQLMAFDGFWDEEGNEEIEVLKFKTTSCTLNYAGGTPYWVIEFKVFIELKPVIVCIDSISDICDYKLHYPTNYQCHLI
ncbi:hypothetical protein [Scytonema sp. NUACC26]|uniref:hypothetical protein n=1 Tax=Scytonema sp. NUACC26 TaxID=3140176 RepID=UPI0034DBA99D